MSGIGLVQLISANHDDPSCVMPHAKKSVSRTSLKFTGTPCAGSKVSLIFHPVAGDALWTVFMWATVPPGKDVRDLFAHVSFCAGNRVIEAFDGAWIRASGYILKNAAALEATDRLAAAGCVCFPFHFCDPGGAESAFPMLPMARNQEITMTVTFADDADMTDVRFEADFIYYDTVKRQELARTREFPIRAVRTQVVPITLDLVNPTRVTIPLKGVGPVAWCAFQIAGSPKNIVDALEISVGLDRLVYSCTTPVALNVLEPILRCGFDSPVFPEGLFLKSFCTSVRSRQYSGSFNMSRVDMELCLDLRPAVDAAERDAIDRITLFFHEHQILRSAK